jgi:transposase
VISRKHGSEGAAAQQCAVATRPGHGDVTRLPDQWRGIATRYEKTATIYLAGLHIAGIFLWSAR